MPQSPSSVKTGVRVVQELPSTHAEDVRIEVQHSPSQRSPVDNSGSLSVLRIGTVPIKSAQEPEWTGNSLATG